MLYIQGQNNNTGLVHTVSLTLHIKRLRQVEEKIRINSSNMRPRKVNNDLKYVGYFLCSKLIIILFFTHYLYFQLSCMHASARPDSTDSNTQNTSALKSRTPPLQHMNSDSHHASLQRSSALLTMTKQRCEYERGNKENKQIINISYVDSSITCAV